MTIGHDHECEFKSLKYVCVFEAVRCIS